MRSLEEIYQKSMVVTKNPAEITIMMFDKIIKNTENIKKAIVDLNISVLKENIKQNKTLLTELVLQASASKDIFPPGIAQNLEEIYSGCLRRLEGIQLTRDLELCDHLINHILPIKEAYEEKLKEGE